MTTPTTGSISFSDLRTEFGDTDPISISDYYSNAGLTPNPTIAYDGTVVPSIGSAISMSQLHGITTTPWQAGLIRVVNGSSFIPFVPHLVACDSTGNMYLLGRSLTVSVGTYYWSGVIAKVDKRGVLQWASQITGGGVTGIIPVHLDIDASGSIWIYAQKGTITAAVIKAAAADGTLQGVRSYAYSYLGRIYDTDMVMLGTDCYVVGYDLGYKMHIGRINSSLDVVWYASFFRTAAAVTPTGITARGSNVYVVGTSVTSGTNQGNLIKYDTSGNVVWARDYAAAVFQAAAVDAAGSVYCVGSGTGTQGVVVKYDSSGAMVWQKVITASYRLFHAAIGPDGYLYTSNDSELAFKFDPSTGSVVWQRTVPACGIAGISFNKNSDVILSQVASDTNKGLVYLVVPADGTKTGSIVDSLNSNTYTYTTASLTVADATSTSSTMAYTTGTLSATANTTGLGLSLASFTGFSTFTTKYI